MDCYWLLEKKENGLLVYIHQDNYKTTNDPWQAKRFQTKEDVQSYLKTESLVGQGFEPAEHGFATDEKKGEQS